MSALYKHSRTLFIGKAGTHGHAACYSLCKCGYIGLYAVSHGGEDRTCSANACLNLVGNCKDIVFSAELEYLVNKGFIKGIYSALALNELKHNCADRLILGDKLSESVDIVGRNVHKALYKGEEVVVEHVLACCGKGGESSAVE